MGASLVLLVTACTGSSERTPQSRSSPTVSGATTARPQTVADRCGPPKVPARWIELQGPDGSSLVAAVVGAGPATAVFAHQTGVSGLCGFWAYSSWLADRYGTRSVLLDLCGYGQSECGRGAFADDEPAQVALAVLWARQHGAQRTTLVGASLGGTVVSVAAARIEPPVEAMVNLSGPVQYAGLDVADAAPRITVPSLFALARGDPVVTVAEHRQLLEELGTSTNRLFIARYGHGWDMLGVRYEDGFRVSRLGETVAEWIMGRHILGHS